jgi:capsular polysaccharide biosynthesis protein
MNVVNDPGAEREIDLARWKQAAIERWWVVAAGIVAGIIVGGLYSLSGGTLYRASVLIAPGSAFSPSGAPVLNYLSSPRGINDLVTSEATLKQAADQTKVGIGQLRGHVTTANISTGAGVIAARGTVLIQIVVQLAQPKHAEDVANALGAIAVKETTSPYVRQSIDVLNGSIAGYQTQLTSLTRRIKLLNDAISTQHLDTITKIILVSQADNAAQRQATISNNLAIAEQQLSLAKNIEITQLIGGPARAVKTSARSRRNSILVGLLIGLIAGLIAAVVVDMRARGARQT